MTLIKQAERISRLTTVYSRHFGTFSSLQQQLSADSAIEKPSLQDATLKPASEIPGPKRWPFVGCLFSMLLDKDFDNKRIHIYWKKMAEKYNPIMRLDTPMYPPIVASLDPEDCETVARNTMENPVRLAFFALEKIRQDAVDNYFDKKCGLLTENYEEWKRVRTRVQTPMLKAKNVTSYLPQMDKVTLEFIERIASLQKTHGEMPANFQTELYKWALESVSLVALNRRMGCLDPNLSDDSEPMRLIRQANNIFDALNDTEVSAQLWRIYPNAAYRKLQKSHDEFLKIADHNIQETEKRLLAKDPNSEDDLTLMETLLLTDGLTRKDVVTLILDMLFAGIDTTSHTMAFTLYLLAKNPECQAKLQAEIDKVLGDHQGPITTKHLGQLSYLKAVLKESLRVFPLTLGNARLLLKDTVLSGYLIPKGFIAITLNMFIGHDEKYFPRAKEFIPERWLRHKPLGPMHPYASLPFGLGTRMCIGRRIAEQEMYTLLTRIMQRYHVDYKYKDMDVVTRMVFVPSEPLKFSFTERK
ncbi:hypothetical protein SK128_002127 [Halocaridina rubra]|uniref:Cytochrome P450 n=1 Tax=Halocaridina rubra TaxID=373956 RepID=A0AAN9FTL5_HALRR